MTLMSSGQRYSDASMVLYRYASSNHSNSVGRYFWLQVSVSFSNAALGKLPFGSTFERTAVYVEERGPLESRVYLLVRGRT